MPVEKMTRCETKRLYKNEGMKEWRWVEIAVADVSDEREIRCMHCHGAVKVLKAKAPVGAQGHVAHRSKVDTDNCQGGRGPQGNSGLSSRPIE